MTWLNVETRAEQPLRARQIRLIPFAQAARVTLPGGVLIWSRPTAILAQSADGDEVVLPIRDVTRQAQVILLGLGILCSWLIWFFYRN